MALGFGLLLAADPAILRAQEAANAPDADPGLLDKAKETFFSIFSWGEDPPPAEPSAAEPQEMAVPETSDPIEETPLVETPEIAAPEAETPEAGTPEAVTPEAVTPEADAPVAETPEADAPVAATPEAETPETEVPETAVSDSPIPDAEPLETTMPKSLPSDSPPLAGAEPLAPEPTAAEAVGAVAPAEVVPQITEPEPDPEPAKVLQAQPAAPAAQPAAVAKPDPIVLPAAEPKSRAVSALPEGVIVLIRESGVVLNAPWPRRKPDIPDSAASSEGKSPASAGQAQSAALPETAAPAAKSAGRLPSPEEEAASIGMLLPTLEPKTPQVPSAEVPTQQQPAPKKKAKAEAKARPAATGDTQALGSALKELMKTNPVVARVEGEDLRWTDVMNSAQDLPERYQSQIEAIFPALLDRMVDLRLLAKAAADSGIDDEAEVRSVVQKFEDNLLREIFIRRQVTNKISESDLRSRYAEMTAEAAAADELRARHILLDSEAEAREVIGMLDQGADFAALARERSSGPSAKRGGDLGYFDPSRMVPEFAKPLQTLQEGAYARAPVQSAFGWHVILLVDRRANGLPPFAEMKGDLRRQMIQERMDAVIHDLRATAEIELFPEYPDEGLAGAVE